MDHLLKNSKPILFQKSDEKTGFSVVIEDDGLVCYAYLHDRDGDIISDVWLYNRCEAPIVPQWNDKENLPFANPAEFIRSDLRYKIPYSEAEFDVYWLHQAGSLTETHIVLNGLHIAILVPYLKPGFSLLAIKDGPLGLAMQPS
jgi:hypothetical protein